MIRRWPLWFGGWILLLSFTAYLVPATAQSLALDIYNSRRVPSGPIWGSGNWIAFTVEEDEKDLNGDGDTDDAVLHLLDLRTFQVQNTGIAIDIGLLDNEDEWPVAFAGDQIVVCYSEADNGMKDRNGNGTATDNLFALYDPVKKTYTILPFGGRNPKILDGRLYFLQSEAEAKQDLNGDGDQLDWVLCVYDFATKKVESLGMEADAGYYVAGTWIATMTSEAAQGGKDLNGDGDISDVVAQVYSTTGRQWVNTGLECSAGIALTPKLLAVAVEEKFQGNKDLNGDGDTNDTVLFVWDLSPGLEPSQRVINTGMDCSGGIAATDIYVGFVTSEAAQGNKDLNGDGDTDDDVVQCFSLQTKKVTNLAMDGSGGIVADSGKIAFVCSEAAQGHQDLNKDGDADDDVLMVYDPAKNRVINVGYAVDGPIIAAEGVLAFRVSEADHFNRDLNRDGDTDDSVVFVMNLATHAVGSTALAGTERMRPTSRGVGFAVSEEDQGMRDLNGNGDTNDEVLHVARLRR